MCDTMVALGNSTQDGSVIFAKNSDRQPNEPLLTIRVPRRKYAVGAKLKCTYIEIDQVEETFEVLLLKPSWMWGAEMGANEFGLNIGNEAVFTREKQGPEALLGMDMLRLALERCRTSEQALDLIIDLLERYGQGGNCGFEKKFFYHNSFLIADPESAWVIETAGEYWAAQKVEDVRSISNRISIGSAYDRGHPDLIKHAVAKRWCKGEADFDFARCYSDPLITRFSGSGQRSGASGCTLEQEKGRITAQTMKEILRSHEDGLEGKQFTRHSLKSVCMHGGFIYGDQTTGSYVATLLEKNHTYLITGSSAPCIALYKPFWMVDGENFSFTEDEMEEALEFWRKREQLHRYVIENKVPELAAYLVERDRIEKNIDEQIMIFGGDRSNENRLKEIMDYALNEEANLVERTLRSIPEKEKPGKIKGNPYFKYYWKKQNLALRKAEQLRR
ncbi:MAG TPA: hypothetical protein VLH18_07840 [Candidatus Limnocylindrales bacterium]|nr:hypothetical protein [Candidatus Limnocylindrales bacterium]